jgi:hypothetical protein
MNGTIRVNVLVGPNAAVAEVSGPDGIVGVGDSKRNNGEPFNPRVAADLAIGRALEALGGALVTNALLAAGS